MQLAALASLVVLFAVADGQTASSAQHIPANISPKYCEQFTTIDLSEQCASMRALTSPAQAQIAVQDGNLQVSSASPNVINAPERLKSEDFLRENWIALAALFISLVTAFLSHRQFRRTRERSIRDEFWIRQVTYPYVLQPSLDFIEWCVGFCPEPESSGDEMVAKIRQEFNDKRRTVLGRIAILRAMAVPDRAGRIIKALRSAKARCKIPARPKNAEIVAKDFEDSLEQVQDRLMLYLADLATNDADIQQYRDTVAKIQEQSGRMIRALNQWQYDM